MKLSLRTRIALLSALSAALALTAFAVAAWRTVYAQNIAMLDAEMRTFAVRLPGRGAGRPGGGMGRIEQTGDFLFGSGRAKILLRDGAGADLFRSQEWPLPVDPPLPPAPQDGAPTGPAWQMREIGFSMQKLATGNWRVGQLAGRDASVVIALPIAGVEERMRALSGRFLLIGLPMLGFVMLAGWWIAGRALRPVREVARSASRIEGGGWEHRIPPAPEAPEIDRMIAALNRMLDHLEAARRQAGRFSADASHELQTPLAVLQATIEDALADAPPGSREEALCLDLMEEVGRIKTITANLLMLARVDAGTLRVLPEKIDLIAELNTTVEEAACTSPTVTWELDGPFTAPMHTDKSLLRIILRNMIGNAFKFSPDGGRVRISVIPRSGQVGIEVANPGAAIPVDERERVFERFMRGTSSGGDTPGQGLGLALARECARCLGGDVLLLEHDGDAVRFLVELPSARPEVL